MSSVAAIRSPPLHAAYGAAKHGREGFIEARRVELMHDRAPGSVTSIRPSTMNTPIFDKGRSKLGVKGIGPPPIYQPQIAAKAILHAAENPVRDVGIGGMARAVELLDAITPASVDYMLAVMGHRVQRSLEPRHADAPDSLFSALPGFGRVEGDLGDVALRRSVYTWLERHRRVRQAGFAGALAGVVLARGRRGRLGFPVASTADRRTANRHGRTDGRFCDVQPAAGCRGCVTCQRVSADSSRGASSSRSASRVRAGRRRAGHLRVARRGCRARSP